MFLFLSLACAPATDDTAAETVNMTSIDETDTGTTPTEGPPFEDVFALLNRACGDCHYSPYMGQFIEPESAVTTHSLLLTAEPHLDQRARYVVPGNLEESLLIDKLQPEPREGAQMPPEDQEQDPLTEAEVDLLTAWVAAGAWD